MTFGRTRPDATRTMTQMTETTGTDGLITEESMNDHHDDVKSELEQMSHTVRLGCSI